MVAEKSCETSWNMKKFEINSISCDQYNFWHDFTTFDFQETYPTSEISEPPPALNTSVHNLDTPTIRGRFAWRRSLRFALLPRVLGASLSIVKSFSMEKCGQTMVASLPKVTGSMHWFPLAHLPRHWHHSIFPAWWYWWKEAKNQRSSQHPNWKPQINVWRFVGNIKFLENRKTSKKNTLFEASWSLYFRKPAIDCNPGVIPHHVSQSEVRIIQIAGFLKTKAAQHHEPNSSWRPCLSRAQGQVPGEWSQIFHAKSYFQSEHLCLLSCFPASSYFQFISFCFTPPHIYF